MSSTPFGGSVRSPRTHVGGIAKAPQSWAADTYRSDEGPVAQSTLLDIGGAENSETYTLTFASAALPETQTVTVETDSDATAQELGDLIQAAIEGNATLGGLITEIERPSGATQDVRIRYHAGDPAVTVTATANPGDHIVVTNTAAAAGVEAPLGRFWTPSDGPSYGDNRILSRLSESSGPVSTVTITVNADGDTFADVYATPGAASPVTAVGYDADTDLATTVPVAVVAYKAAFPQAEVEGNTATGVITIELPVGFEIAPISNSAAGTSTIDTSVAAGDDAQMLRFILSPGDEVPETIGAEVTGIRAGSPIPALRSLHGEVGAEHPDESIDFGGDVWVETAAGADNGRPFATATPTRQKAQGAYWIRQDESDPELALMQIDTLA